MPQKGDPRELQSWLGSKHGINSVKCGICHGDVNNYRARPDRVVCIGCHSAQVHNMPAQALGDQLLVLPQGPLVHGPQDKRLREVLSRKRAAFQSARLLSALDPLSDFWRTP